MSLFEIKPGTPSVEEFLDLLYDLGRNVVLVVGLQVLEELRVAEHFFGGGPVGLLVEHNTHTLHGDLDRGGLRGRRPVRFVWSVASMASGPGTSS